MEITTAKSVELGELASFARTTYEHAFGNELDPAALQRHLKEQMSDARFAQMLKSDRFYLARNKNQLAGFAQIGAVDPAYKKYLANFDPNASELRRLYVVATLQSQGIGSALIERASQDPMVTNNLYLTTWETNYGAQRLYRKHNFERAGRIPEYGSGGELTGYEHIMVRRT